jgi:hypothetical protein
MASTLFQGDPSTWGAAEWVIIAVSALALLTILIIAVVFGVKASQKKKAEPVPEAPYQVLPSPRQAVPPRQRVATQTGPYAVMAPEQMQRGAREAILAAQQQPRRQVVYGQLPPSDAASQPVSRWDKANYPTPLATPRSQAVQYGRLPQQPMSQAQTRQAPREALQQLLQTPTPVYGITSPAPVFGVKPGGGVDWNAVSPEEGLYESADLPQTSDDVIYSNDNMDLSQ